MTTYFLYARKSTDVEDKQVLSIEAQLAELRELAKRENLSIADEFIEKRSAKMPGRPIFNDMLRRIQTGETRRLIKRKRKQTSWLIAWASAWAL